MKYSDSMAGGDNHVQVENDTSFINIPQFWNIHLVYQATKPQRLDLANFDTQTTPFMDSTRFIF